VGKGPKRKLYELEQVKMSYHKDLGIDTHFDYNQAGWEMRRFLHCIPPSFPRDSSFDVNTYELEEFGNDVRRSDWLVPISMWDKIYKYPTSQQIRAFIRRAGPDLKQVFGRSPATHEITIHEGRFIRWWEKRRPNAK
jgi:hypothetical protein